MPRRGKHAWQDGEIHESSPQRWFARAVAGFSRGLTTESDRWFLWLPVLFAGGILIYFALPTEPDPTLAIALVIGAAGLAVALKEAPLGLAVAGALLMLASGFATAKLHTELARAPVLARELRYVEVKAWLETIDRAHARHLARDRGGLAEPGRDPLSCPRHGRFRHGPKRKDGGCGPPQGHPQTTSRLGRSWSLRFRPHRLVLSPWHRRLRDIRSGACARSAKPTLGTRPLGRHQPLVRSHQCARASGAAGPDRRPRGGTHHRRPRRHERLDSER